MAMWGVAAAFALTTPFQFDAKVLADMIAALDRFTDSEIPVPDGLSVVELRTFYATWRSELSA